MRTQLPWRRLRRLFRQNPTAEVKDELEFHLEERVRDYVARGMSLESARRSAVARLGDLERVRGECTTLLSAERRADERRRSLSVSWLDVKLGLRMLVNYPGLSLVAGLGIMVGIAISAGSFAFWYWILYPVLPLEEGDRIVALTNSDITANQTDRRSLHDFVTWREQMKSVVEISAFRDVEPRLVSGDGSAEVAKVAEMTASGFHVARVPPLLGRYLVEDDEREGAPPVIVIGHDVWRTRFEQEPSVIGQEVRIGETVHTVVGVMPEGFGFPKNHQYWIPFRANPVEFARGEGPEIFVFGRLATGATMQAAQAELTTIGRRTAASYPETHAQLRPNVWPYAYPFTGVAQPGIAVLVIGFQLMISLILVVVALNVAILVYARTARRWGEIVVRTALGASRIRVVSQLFVEALVLALGPALLGLALAQVGFWQGMLFIEQGPDTPFWVEYSLRPATAFYTMGLVVLVAAIVGIIPALQATGSRVQFDVRQLGGATGMRLGRMWTVLIVAQIAIVVAALPVPVRFGLGEIDEALTRPTFAAEELLLAGLTIESETSAAADSSEQRVVTLRFRQQLSELIRRLESEPDVAGVTFLSGLPGRTGRMRLEVDGVAAPASSPSGHDVVSIGVGPEYFDVHDARIVAGREFGPQDENDAGNAVIVSRSFVQQVLDGGTAVGRRIRYLPQPSEDEPGEAQPSRWYEIVGVAEDLYANPIAPELIQATVFNPVAQPPVPGLGLVLRLRAPASPASVRKLREVVATVDPDLRIVNVRTGETDNRQQQRAVRLIAVVLGLVILSVLVLSAATVYALMSFTVTQRRREIGIRSALGAVPHRLLLSVFSRAARQLGLGVVAGLAGAVLLERMTGGVAKSGPMTMLVPLIALIVVAVGLCAALGPARRSLRVQPVDALRAE